MQSALLVYMECDWTVEPASKCLSMLGVRKRWRTLRQAVLQDMLERECLAENEDDLMKVLSAREQRVDSAAARAHTYILELRLSVWCRSINSKHGHASSTADVLKKSVRIDATSAAAIHSKTRTGRPSAIACKCESRYDDGSNHYSVTYTSIASVGTGIAGLAKLGERGGLTTKDMRCARTSCDSKTLKHWLRL